jgi:hypothetical protein
MSQSKLRNYIRKTIRELLDDSQIDETTFTGNVSGYNTPFAFSGKNSTSKKKKKKIATNSTGFEVVKEGKYHDWRNDDTMTPKQKIGIAMRETRDKLNELDRLVKMNVKLKNELSIDSRSYWKNTHKAMGKISEKLVRLSNRIGKMY